MVSTKTALVIEVLASQDYNYHYTYRKILVLMVLITRGDLPSTQTLEMRKSFSFLSFSTFLTALGHKKAITLQPFIARSFSKLVLCFSRDSVSGSIFDYVIIKMADCSQQGTKVFLKNWQVCFVGPYRPTSIQQGKSFNMYL